MISSATISSSSVFETADFSFGLPISEYRKSLQYKLNQLKSNLVELINNDYNDFIKIDKQSDLRARHNLQQYWTINRDKKQNWRCFKCIGWELSIVRAKISMIARKSERENTCWLFFSISMNLSRNWNRFILSNGAWVFSWNVSLPSLIVLIPRRILEDNNVSLIMERIGSEYNQLQFYLKKAEKTLFHVNVQSVLFINVLLICKESHWTDG